MLNYNVKSKKAQSTLEYLLILVTLIAIILAFAKGALKESVGGALDKLADAVKSAGDKF